MHPFPRLHGSRVNHTLSLRFDTHAAPLPVAVQARASLRPSCAGTRVANHSDVAAAGAACARPAAEHSLLLAPSWRPGAPPS